MKRVFLLFLLINSLNYTLIRAQVIDLKNEYSKDIYINDMGRILVRMNLIGRPPKDYQAPVTKLPDLNNRDANIIQEVPAFNWSFGCGPTSAAMIAGYYDRTGYENMYTGPSNHGMMPLNNSLWRNIDINGDTLHQCPLSATRQGLDGRISLGHVDDYWHSYLSQIDPYFGNWDQHPYGDCTADFMGASQYHNWNIIDGGTYVYVDFSGTPVYDYTGCEPTYKDCCHGFREFIESRGYNIQSNGNFTQTIYGYNGSTNGFSFEQYKAEIDAGRPVMLLIMGHAMVGFGYDDSYQNVVYMHNTWDYEDHSMIWGGSYSGMAHYAVVIFRLEEVPVGIHTDQVINLEALLEQNYPNPFNPSTTISFSINTENAELMIFNLKGQKIRQYSISNDQSSIVWDGTDQTGKSVSSGIYFYKIRTGTYVHTKKMILMK